MRKTILIILLLAGAAVAGADDWTIKETTREECAKDGGCILTIPDGHLIRMKDVSKAIKEIADASFAQGAAQGIAAGKQTCSRRDI